MERLTNEDHREIGFVSYNGAQNPFKLPLTIGELAGCLNADYSPRKILEDVFSRLAAYEDTGLEPENVTDLMAAHGMAIEKLAEYRMREKKKAPKCYSPDTERCYNPDADVGCRYMVPDGDDEPIDRCKKCPLCYADKQRHRPEPQRPLTLEELREMDGEPVWIEWGGHPQAGWALVRVWSKANNTVYLTYHNGNTDLLGFVLNDGGKIYRRKPEEV